MREVSVVIALNIFLRLRDHVVTRTIKENVVNQTAITFVALGGAILLWSVGTGLTSYIADGPAREYSAKGHAEHAKKPESGVRGNVSSEKDIEKFVKEEVQKLTEQIDKSIADKDLAKQEELRVALSNFLFESGIRFSKSEYLKDAVGNFHETLQINPNQKDALLGLATLSLHVGAGDKAEEYYERYLQIEPQDTSAKSNLALAMLRAGKNEQALSTIGSVLEKEPELVIALVTKGIILKELGKKEEALQFFNKAEALEKSPTLLQRIAVLKSDQKTEQKSSDIISYFKNHQILGQKIKNIKVNNALLEVYVENFPVEKMPEFAKVKLEGSIKAELNSSKYASVSLIDSNDNKVLLRVDR